MSAFDGFRSPDEHNDGNGKSPHIHQQIQEADQALEKISGTLNHMLALADLSASDGNVDRELLQKVVEHLKKEIDRIADHIETL